jgi:FkbM family methyltransferase
VLKRPMKVLAVIWARYLKWPMPLWRLRGRGTFSLAGEPFVFYGVADSRHAWWALRARRRRWEAEALSFFADTLEPDDVVFDIGAYIGPYTLLASRRVGPRGRVYAFEPDPVARRLLARNVEANGATNVSVLPYAVSDEDGMVWLHSTQLGNATTSISPAIGIERVEAVTLWSFCERHSLFPSVIKVDVEGWEGHVLSEAARPVVDHARATLVEVHEWQLRQCGMDPTDFIRRITAWGEMVYVERRAEFEGNYTVALV